MRDKLKRLLIVGFISCGGFVLLLASSQRFLLFPTFAIPETLQSKPSADTEVIWHERDGHKVEVWFMRARSPDVKRPVVFFAPGNGALIDQYEKHRFVHATLDYHIVLMEYRGYGRTPGSPSEDDIVADFVSVYDRIIARNEVDPDHVIFHGQSLGGGIVSSAARQRLPNKLILESTFTSIPDIADTVIPLAGYLIVDEFETEDFLKTIDIPVLIIHGTDDKVVPYPHGLALKTAAKNSHFYSVPNGSHMLYWDGRYQSAVKDFLTQTSKQ